jgi:hypothetical protein
MSQETNTVKIKAIRPIIYKDISIDEGKTADVEPHVAERLIAGGHAEQVAEKAPKGEK